MYFALEQEVTIIGKKPNESKDKIRNSSKHNGNLTL